MSDRPYFTKIWFRTATFAIGGLLSCLGIYVLFAVSNKIAGVILGLVLTVFGVESIIAAIRKKLSWLAKIGPLP